jgi:3-oxoacyl-[acyl-carrier protein] reductase
MRNDLLGRVALVTGGSRGIGRAIALELARVGADIAVNYHGNEQAAREVCQTIQQGGRRAIAVQGDVSRPDDVSRMVETIRAELGPITVLVNNAGIGHYRSIEEVTEADWDETQATNLKGPFLVTQAVLPDMRSARWGRIIAISSVAAQTGGVVGLHYASSKAGLLGLMHYYAGHLATEGITANSIAPGAIRTDMAANLPQLRPENIPVGRLGTPEEIADAAVMLACNGYITGQTININGGRYPG